VFWRCYLVIKPVIIRHKFTWDLANLEQLEEKWPIKQEVKVLVLVVDCIVLGCWLQGRTGVMICAYLLHSGQCSDPQAALQLYSTARTMDEKVSIQQPFISLLPSSD